MFYWTEERVRFMRDAAERTGFFSRIIREILPDLDGVQTLCDAGCGLGGLSLHLAPYLSEITAIDTSDEALRELNQMAKERKIGNIRTRCGRIEDLEPGTPYSSMLFSFFGRIESILPIAAAQCTGPVFVLKKDYRSHRFSITHHDMPGKSTDYAVSYLKKCGIPFQMTPLSVEYGEPFRSTEDAVSFFRLYSRPEDASRIDPNTVLDSLVRTEDPVFPYYLPGKRDLGLIRFRASDLPSAFPKTEGK